MGKFYVTTPIYYVNDRPHVGRNPKVLMGYSDITALLLAVYARTGLVTFHGPDGISTWNAFSTGYFRRVVMEAGTPTMENPTAKGDNLAQTRDRTTTIRGGRARGRLAGGNLSVLAGLCGSPYLPSWEDTILFLEDVDEDIYRVDRMLTTLKLAGVLGGVRGVVFGKCTRCGPGEGYGSLTFGEVLGDHLAPLGVPCYEGAMIGHVADKFTVPLGVEAEIDADAGTIRKQVGIVDVILVGVKAWQVPEAAQAMRPMVGPHTIALSVQNGVEAPSQLAVVLGAEHVLGGLCGLMVFIAGPGHIRHAAVDPFIGFAELDNRPSQRVEKLSQVFSKAQGVRVDNPPDIHVGLWPKFLFVTGVTGVGAVTRAPIGIYRSQPGTRRMLEQVAEEICEVAWARKIALPQDAVTKSALARRSSSSASVACLAPRPVHRPQRWTNP